MAEYLFIDMHMHSILSDEDLCDETPIHILGKVQRYADNFREKTGRDLSCCISITDHNSTLSALEVRDLMQTGEYPNVKFINGCEFTVDLCEMNSVFGVDKTFSRCHLLAYNFKEDDKELVAYSRIAHKRYSNEDNIGLQILASRRMICERYGINIPFSVYEPLVDLKQNYFERIVLRELKLYANAFLDYLQQKKILLVYHRLNSHRL